MKMQNKTRIKVARTSITLSFYYHTRASCTHSPLRLFTFPLSNTIFQYFVRNVDAVPGIRRYLHANHRSNGVRRCSETRGSFISSHSPTLFSFRIHFSDLLTHFTILDQNRRYLTFYTLIHYTHNHFNPFLYVYVELIMCTFCVLSCAYTFNFDFS